MIVRSGQWVILVALWLMACRAPATIYDVWNEDLSCWEQTEGRFDGFNYRSYRRRIATCPSDGTFTEVYRTDDACERWLVCLDTWTSPIRVSTMGSQIACPLASHA